LKIPRGKERMEFDEVNAVLVNEVLEDSAVNFPNLSNLSN